MIQHNQIQDDNDLYLNRQYHQMQLMLVVHYLFHYSHLHLFVQFFAIIPKYTYICVKKFNYTKRRREEKYYNNIYLLIDYHTVHYINLNIQSIEFKDN